MKIVALVFLLLLAPAVFAELADHLADARFIMVVRDDAPASDVVFAANFAQTLKAQSSVVFVGATESEIADATDEELSDKILVYLNAEDETAEIVIGADASKVSSVREAAEDYLDEKNFDVEVEIGAESRSSGGVEGVVVEETTLDTDDFLKNLKNTTNETVSDVVEVVPVVAVETSVSVNNTSTNTTTEAETGLVIEENDDNESVFSSFWNWIKGIFS